LGCSGTGRQSPPVPVESRVWIGSIFVRKFSAGGNQFPYIPVKKEVSDIHSGLIADDGNNQ
jgi:hypothetical protein